MITVPFCFKRNETMKPLDFSVETALLLFRQGAPLPRVLALFVFSDLEHHRLVHGAEIWSYFAQFHGKSKMRLIMESPEVR
jgi:hypothetical protein